MRVYQQCENHPLGLWLDLEHGLGPLSSYFNAFKQLGKARPRVAAAFAARSKQGHIAENCVVCGKCVNSKYFHGKDFEVDLLVYESGSLSLSVVAHYSCVSFPLTHSSTTAFRHFTRHRYHHTNVIYIYDTLYNGLGPSCTCAPCPKATLVTFSPPRLICLSQLAGRERTYGATRRFNTVLIALGPKV